MSRSVLLIDDDAEILSFLGRFFEGRGWIVNRASDGSSGVELYERERPDVVLLDLEMPRLSGLRVLEILRARDEDATVILLTGHGDIAKAVEAMQLGAENFLTKPVEITHLEAASERAFEKVELRRRNRFFAERQTEEQGLAALGCSRANAFAGLAARAKSTSTCASSRLPTRSSRKKSVNRGSAKTSTIGSPSCRCACRHCASAGAMKLSTWPCDY